VPDVSGGARLHIWTRACQSKPCASDLDTHFYAGTILAHPKSWVVIGVYWPPKLIASASSHQARLPFD
jgi:hypothetical protein